jgi:RND superfamily putative drug exporter
MNRLARLSVDRPRRVIGVWLAVMLLLALAGMRVEDDLHRVDLTVPGSDSARAQELSERHFGDSSTLSILLTGPPRALDRQGPQIAAALDRHRAATVLTPWMSAGRGLRVEDDRAIVVVRIDRPFEYASEHVVPLVRKTLDRETRPPLDSHLTGYADIAAGIERSSLDALRKAELIAAPILLIVLLFVFRSVVAAALPLILGMVSIGAARGVLAFVNGSAVPLDSVALNFASMFGLALGVDYSLLMISRFREERRAGRDPNDAALVTAMTAGRTVLFAGIALAAALLAGYFVAPGDVLTSAAVGGLAGATLSVVGAVTAVPAALAVLSPWLDRWQIGRSEPSEDGRSGRLAWRAVRYPALAAGIVLTVLAAFAMPALGLKTGSPDPRMLPKAAPERVDALAIERGLGGAAAGWAAPYEVIVATDRGSVTDASRLRAIDRWQAAMLRDPDVSAVLGPGEIYRRTDELRAVPKRLARVERAVESGKRGQRGLSDGLRRASVGVDEVVSGLAAAADGSGQLSDGADAVGSGGDAVLAGVAQAQRGIDRLQSGLSDARAGTNELANGARRASTGARRLRAGAALARDRAAAAPRGIELLLAGVERARSDLQRLRLPVLQGGSELQKALQALDAMTAGAKSDPQYGPARQALLAAITAFSGRNPATGAQFAPDYPGLDAAIVAADAGAAEATRGIKALLRRSRALNRGLTRLASGTQTMAASLARLEAGANGLRRGIGQLGGGGERLRGGLGELGDGGERLAAGVASLREGAGRLHDGISGGSGRTRELQAGMAQLTEATTEFRRKTDRLAGGLGSADRLTPALRSGYFTLAALDGSRPRLRTGASFAVNVDRGGSAARIVVIENRNPRHADDPLRGRLEQAADRLERDTEASVVVGGPATNLQDFASASESRLPLLMLVLMAVTYLILVPVLRSLVLPALAVVLNTLTVIAAFGVLALAFQGDAPLGGPGYIDAIMVIGIASVVFGLSIDYEVFLLARMREGYVRTGNTDGAIAYGLRTTAGVITGAALIMTAVFIAFASADIVSLRQMGVGLTVAVLLDATLVRLVLLPAAVRMAGDSAWWLPGWLDRLLPTVDLGDARDGGGDVAAAPATR